MTNIFEEQGKMKKVLKIGRNDPCICGSNQKYKKCCLPKQDAQSLTSAGQMIKPGEVDGLMKKISRIVESKDMSLEEINTLLMGKSFDEIEAEYDALSPESSTKYQAEALYERALDEPSASKKISFVEKALQMYPGLPDAWCMLGEIKAKTCEEAIPYFTQAVEAGRMDLGDDYFKENEGHFWGLIETRPFMRAKTFLADALLNHGRIDEAMTHFEDCLRLNPNDNQGIRYELLSLYLMKDRLDDVKKILDKYKEDSGATWEYSKALYLFKKYGPKSIKAAKQLNKAKKENIHVIDYLTRKRKLPKTVPSSYIQGGQEEAKIYISEGLAAWESTPGALEWFNEWN